MFSLSKSTDANINTNIKQRKCETSISFAGVIAYAFPNFETIVHDFISITSLCIRISKNEKKTRLHQNNLIKSHFNTLKSNIKVKKLKKKVK